MAVLYQKYRPQRFSEVVGQDSIVRTLLNASKTGQLAHAFLLTGSRGIGKTTIARIVAKAANCLDLKDGDPCGTCDNCTAIAGGNFLDVVEIDAASHTGVDNIRELIEHVAFKPSHGKVKVFIIDEVHMLSKAAFNALLKTLEEPPDHAMFILATTDIEKVPETIISRTQRFDFRKITSEAMREAVAAIAKKEHIALPEGTLELIVTNAEGGLRDALSLLGTIAALGDAATPEDVRALLGLTTINTIESLAGMIIRHDTAGLPEFFETQNAEGVDFVLFNRNVLEYLRLMLVQKVTGHTAGGVLDAAQSESLQQLAGGVTLPQLLFIIRLFLRSYKEISQSPLPELPILLAAIEASLHGSAASPAPQPAAQPAVQPVQPPPQAKPRQSQMAAAQHSPGIVAEPVVETATPTIDKTVTRQEVEQWWPEVIQRIKAVNSPLATLLKNSPLQDVSEGRVTIGVKYLFHKEHLENTKHTALVLETIHAVSGKKLFFRAIIVKETDETVVTHTVDALGDAIKIFGGELIE